VSKIADGNGPDRVKFSVQDTGIGIATSVLDRLFQPFTQADTSTTRRFGGTGLGLSIVRKLVEMMGGDIGASSTEGTGSTFWFALPAQVVASATLEANKRSGRILVVDDNERARTTLAEQLEEFGFSVALAGGGVQALEMLRATEQRFDLVFVDHHMPQLDGIALGAEVSGAPDLVGTRLVLMTSVDRSSDMQSVTAEAFFGYVTKPMRTTAMLDCIERAQRPASSPESSAQAEATPSAHPARRNFSARVLIAEDNIVNQRVARRFLERLGCTVDVVDDGSQAVETLQRASYDFVLMDMQMPIMDGLEACRRIRAQEQPGQRVPIVALTADAMVGTLERCLAAGMDDYLTKPIDVKRLEQVLDTFISQRRKALCG
jgi:two-component system sensor histidine kinase/response regulator